MHRINYHHLYLFYSIAKAGSIAKASRELLLAQPTLSTQLRVFEKAMGRRLFDRDARKFSLTEEGRVVLRYAEAIFQIGQELADDLRDRPSQSSLSIQVGIVTGIPRTFTHAMLCRILEAYPEVQITCHEASFEQLLLDLREFRLDIVLSDDCFSVGPNSRFNVLRIGMIPILLAAKPAIARQYSRLPKDLDGAPMLLPRVPGDVFRLLQAYFSQHSIKPRVVAEVQNVEDARRLAIAGYGIAPLDFNTFSASRPKNALAVVGDGCLAGIHDSIYLVTFADRLRLNPIANMLRKSFRLSRVHNRV
ncbi:MAG: LysR family transcriptional regulator [Elusimicrobiota bacterium]